jgi:hypothetical protein
MNVEIGAEAALFLEKEYIKGIFCSALTTTIKGGKTTIEWTPELDSAFQHSKKVLAMALPLA